LDEEQSQESSTIESDLNQDNDSYDEWLSTPAAMPAASQYLNSDLNPTLGGTPLSPITTTLPVNAMDMELATIASNVGLVEARAVTEESTLTILQEAQEVDAYQLSKSLQKQAEKDLKELKERQCHRIGYCLIAGSLIVISLSLGTGLGLRKVDTNAQSLSLSMAPSSVPSSAPTSYLGLLYDDLPIFTQLSLQNYSTPQWSAFDWLSNHQNISNLPEWRKKQLFALATFFYAMQGPSWNKKIRNDWMDETNDECNWFSSLLFGVFDPVTRQWSETANYSSCNTNGEMEVLAFQYLQLAGLEPSIPPEIILLSSLASISLYQSNITASLHHFLPSELYQMTNLTTLHVSSNSVVGEIPSELGLLTSLTILSLSDNALHGKLPPQP
jgi:hypothetical protein